MRKLFLASIFMLISSLISISAQSFRGFSVGASGGYTNNQTFTGEGFFQVDLHPRRIAIEPKAGLSYHSYNTSLEFVNNLDVQNIGLFIEGAIYPFEKYLYTGIRWEILNVNWFTDQSMNRLDEIFTYTPAVFLGTSFYGTIGVNIPIGESISFRVYGMPGIHAYKISDWEISNNNINLSSPGESHTKFVFQLNASIVYKITNRQKK
jgi:hypothetical protein